MGFKHRHTKGSWDYNRPTKNTPSKVTVSAVGGAVNIYDAPKTVETEANAKLIANAPKLLQIAEMFYDYIKDKDNIVKIITEKVLKDTGVIE